MTNLKLLTEFNAWEFDKEKMLSEQASAGKYIMRGILQKADTLNQNGRIYPQDILEREVDKNKVLFYIYNDGTVEKKLIVE